jgi:hypothetical protein
MAIPEPILLLALTTLPILIELTAAHAARRFWLWALPAVLAATLIGAITWPRIRHHIEQRLRDAPAHRQTSDGLQRSPPWKTSESSSTADANGPQPDSLNHSAIAVPSQNTLVLYASGILYFIALGTAAGFLLTPARSDITHKRGTVITQGRAPRRKLKGAITLAGIPLNLFDETKHIKLIGTTGTGKSTAIREILSAALERGDRAIIVDPDGGYAARFYDASKGDAILNPFDPCQQLGSPHAPSGGALRFTPDPRVRTACVPPPLLMADRRSRNVHLIEMPDHQSRENPYRTTGKVSPCQELCNKDSFSFSSWQQGRPTRQW